MAQKSEHPHCIYPNCSCTILCELYYGNQPKKQKQSSNKQLSAPEDDETHQNHREFNDRIAKENQ